MSSHDELLKQVQSLNKGKKYMDSIELLKDELLEVFQSADLFAEKGEASYRLNRMGLCEINIQKAFTIESSHTKANTYQGHLYLDKKEYEKALACYNLAIKTDPQYAGPYNGLGEVHFELKDYEKAIMFYNTAIQVSPRFDYPYLNLGRLYFELKDYEKAIDCYKKAIELNPANDDAYNDLGNVYCSLKDNDNAVEFYNKAVDVNPACDRVYNNLGIVYDLLKDYEKAIDCYNKAIELNPANDDAYNNLGNVYDLLKDYEKAIDCYNKAIELNPAYEAAYHNLGNVYDSLKDYEKAVRFYNKAIEINPAYEISYNGLGNLYSFLKEYEKAIGFYNKAIEVNPDYEVPFNGLGNLYYSLKEYEAAIRFYNVAIAKRPDFENPYNGLGHVYDDLKDDERAIEFYNRAIEVNPVYEHSYNGLGDVYHNLKEYERAIGFYSKAIEVNPTYELSYNGLGNVYHDLKEYERAIGFYNKAIEVNSSFDVAFYNLGNVYHDLKDYEKAIGFYKQYITLTKNSPDYYTRLARKSVIELAKQIKNTDYSTISQIVDNIKKLLLFDDGYITHYTGMSVTKVLVLNESPLRLSEGAFLNDTSEGGELFRCLPTLLDRKITGGEAIAKAFLPKPFIGSFVTNTRHDDLTLWRMYGKENMEEARGCSITIDGAGLIEDLKSKLSPENNKGVSSAFEDVFKFYRVAYISYSDDKKKNLFIIPDAKKDMEKKLAGHIQELHKAVVGFTAKYKNTEDTHNVLKKLNEIAYLFKSAAYQYEHEVRLIVNGSGFDKNINEDKTPPLVYIELVKITPRLKKITLGPKVARAEEWAAAFYYSLDKQGMNPEIVISHLPFK